MMDLWVIVPYGAAQMNVGMMSNCCLLLRQFLPFDRISRRKRNVAEIFGQWPCWEWWPLLWFVLYSLSDLVCFACLILFCSACLVSLVFRVSRFSQFGFVFVSLFSPMTTQALKRHWCMMFAFILYSRSSLIFSFSRFSIRMLALERPPPKNVKSWWK